MRLSSFSEITETEVSFVTGIGPLQDPVTWYGINYAGTQMTQWDFQNKGTRTSPARLSFVLEVPLRHFHSVPCDWIPQRAYYTENETNEMESVQEKLISSHVRMMKHNLFKAFLS